MQLGKALQRDAHRVHALPHLDVGHRRLIPRAARRQRLHMVRAFGQLHLFVAGFHRMVIDQDARIGRRPLKLDQHRLRRQLDLHRGSGLRHRHRLIARHIARLFDVNRIGAQKHAHFFAAVALDLWDIAKGTASILQPHLRTRGPDVQAQRRSQALGVGDALDRLKHRAVQLLGIFAL